MTGSPSKSTDLSPAPRRNTGGNSFLYTRNQASYRTYLSSIISYYVVKQLVYVATPRTIGFVPSFPRCLLVTLHTIRVKTSLMCKVTEKLGSACRMKQEISSRRNEQLRQEFQVRLGNVQGTAGAATETLIHTAVDSHSQSRCVWRHVWQSRSSSKAHPFPYC